MDVNNRRLATSIAEIGKRLTLSLYGANSISIWIALETGNYTSQMYLQVKVKDTDSW